MVGTGTITDGGEQRLLMVVGRQMPGQLMTGLGGLVGGLGLGGGLFVSSSSFFFLIGGLGGDLVMQHRPLPGQTADLSISSQSREKKPVTQVPRHRTFCGILESEFFSSSSSSSSLSSTVTSFLDSEVSITSSSSSSSSTFSSSS